jgi:hypothetical protein
VLNARYQKNANLSIAARLVLSSGGISRAEMARELGLTRSTVGGVLAPLVERGFIEEAEAVESGPRGGRRAIVLRARREAGAFLGLYVRPGSWGAAARSLCSESPGQWSGSLRSKGVASSVREAFRAAKAAYGRLGLPLLGACVALPGTVNPRDRSLILSEDFGEEGVDLGPALSSFGVPAAVENDANCCAWLDIESPGKGNFLSVLAARGGAEGLSVGMGIVMDGRLRHGASMRAGEFRAPGSGGAAQFAGGRGAGSLGLSGRAERRALIELLRSLAPLVWALDPESVMIHGDIAMDRARLRELCAAEAPGLAEALGARRATLSLAPGPFDVEAGAAACLRSRLLNPPASADYLEGFDIDWAGVFAAAEGGATL